MDYQNVELSVWLGMAVLALACAGLRLWRVRRLVTRLRRGVPVPNGQMATSALADKAGLVRAP